jgi:DNA-binding transcriptional regulator YdaS (Cro superfamily)
MAVRLDDDRLALRIELVRCGMTQRRLSDLVRIPEKVLSDYLLGRRELPAETVAAIREKLTGEN